MTPEQHADELDGSLKRARAGFSDSGGPAPNGFDHLGDDDIPGQDKGADSKAEPPPRRAPLPWDDLQDREPPPMDWIIPHWIPHNHITLLAGRAGIAKTLLAQHIGSAVSLGREYIEPLEPRRVLMWAGEDDEAELWRRQIQICDWLNQPLSALTERFFLYSYAGADITLAASVFGTLTFTSMLQELRQQVGDHKAEVVILDNIARLYGASENDRHAVTTFCAAVQGACAPAAVVLIGHPAKAAGSEYSGSTAWEGAVRARLYLTDRPPSQEQDDDETPADDTVRYLARRKANYSALDIRRFTLTEGGVLVPDAIEPSGPRFDAKARATRAQDIVCEGLKTLLGMNQQPTDAKNGGGYLPRLLCDFKLNQGLTKKELAAAMRDLQVAGRIKKGVVGQYQNRTPRYGLVLGDSA